MDNPHFGLCPRCKEEHFLSVPTTEYGLICIYCLHDLYPPNGLPRSQGTGEHEREEAKET
jgi:hypothetical protein